MVGLSWLCLVSLCIGGTAMASRTHVAAVLIRSLPGRMAPAMARHSDGSEQVFDRKEHRVCVKGDDVARHDYDRQGENLLPLVSSTAFIQSDGGDLLFHVDRDA